MAGHAAAQEIRYWNSGQTIVFEPKMNYIPNTDVYYVRKDTDYGLYRFANRWYLVDEGAWYEAGTWRGPYAAVDVNDVPEDVITIPESYRRHWSAVQVDVDQEISEGAVASARTFTVKPHMSRITSNDVMYARRVRDVDLYRHRGKWFLVDGGVWYQSDSWKGPYLSVSAGSVPRAVLSVPDDYRRHWAVSATYRRRPVDVRYWASKTTLEVEPRMFTIPNTSVRYIRDATDYDLYRYGSVWYIVDEGKWYRSSTWRGPYISIDVSTVPGDVLTIPFEYRRYWSGRGSD
jgi:hypothetical protein